MCRFCLFVFLVFFVFYGAVKNEECITRIVTRDFEKKQGKHTSREDTGGIGRKRDDPINNSEYLASRSPREPVEERGKA